MKLDRLLEKHGASPSAVAEIKDAVRKYLKLGASIEDAEEKAVRDYLEELEGRQEEILSQLDSDDASE